MTFVFPSKNSVGRFSAYLKEETAVCELKYTGGWDVGPNAMWNNKNS